jgi:hypothetical protein
VLSVEFGDDGETVSTFGRGRGRWIVVAAVTHCTLAFQWR